MIEIKDLEPLYEFVNTMSEKGYECDFKIYEPHTTTTYNWDDIEKKPTIEEKIEQRIELKISKYSTRKS